MKDKLNADEAKEEIIRLVGEGKSIANICEIVGKSRQTYDYYRKTDREFAAAVDHKKILVQRDKGLVARPDLPPFDVFCEEYLGMKLSLHQLQWWDLLEGRKPRDLHSAMTYVQGEPDRIIVNTPPGHAKSETITMAWSIYTIIKDPDERVVIISQTQTLAKKFLLRIKEVLTNDKYRKLQNDFGPPKGWKDGASSWTATQFYLSNRDVENKDPTMQAIGIGAQLYGSRATMIILDDTVDNKNHQFYESQREWIQEIVDSRLSRDGKILIVGTRIATKDLYSELQDPDFYFNGKSPYTYLVQPAVLEYAEEPENWKTLWPKSNIPWDKKEEPDENGLYPRWDGVELNRKRNRMTPSGWSRIYMQQQISDNNAFKYEAIKKCIAGRGAGMIPDNEIAGRKGGMNGLYIVAGLDPAAGGFTAMVVLGVDVNDSKRYVVDVSNKQDMQPDEIRNKIKELTLKYKIREWRIENNAFQSYLANDIEIKQWLASNGCILTSHHTGNNKNDPDFGVMAMSALFESGLISIPSPRDNEDVKTFISQLISWEPKNKKIKTDTVMALWFTELRAQELVLREYAGSVFKDTKYTTKRSRANRRIVGSTVNNDPYDLTGYKFGR